MALFKNPTTYIVCKYYFSENTTQQAKLGKVLLKPPGNTVRVNQLQYGTLQSPLEEVTLTEMSGDI